MYANMNQNFNPHKTQNIWDRTWKDKRGRVVIWQTPNIWLGSWAGLTVLSLLLNRGLLADVFSHLGSAALIVWSLLEITRGVNYFRRALGLLILFFEVATIMKSL